MRTKFTRIIRWVNIFLFFQYLDSCGALSDQNLTVDPKVRPVYEAFMNDAVSHYAVIPKDRFYLEITESNNMPENMLGVCKHYGNWEDPWSIGRSILVVRPRSYYYEEEPLVVSPDNWNMQYKATVYHELGHCLLHLDHSSMREYGLMRPMMFDIEPEAWDYLVEELFHRAFVTGSLLDL